MNFICSHIHFSIVRHHHHSYTVWTWIFHFNTKEKSFFLFFFAQKETEGRSALVNILCRFHLKQIIFSTSKPDRANKHIYAIAFILHLGSLLLLFLLYLFCLSSYRFYENILMISIFCRFIFGSPSTACYFYVFNLPALAIILNAFKNFIVNTRKRG